MKSRFAQGAAAVLAAVVLWGAQFPIAKDAFAIVDPFHVTAIRYGIGTVLLMLLLAWREGGSALRYYGKFGPAMLFGFIGMCCSPVLVFFGISLSRPEHAVIIVALQPSMTALADWAVRGRRPSNFTLACVAVAFVGVLTVVTKGNPALMFGQGELAGDLLVLLGSTCWIAYTMAMESFRGWSALRFTVLTLIPGTLGTFAVTAALVATGKISVPGAAALASIGWELVYLTLGGIVIGMVCWNAGNQIIGALNTMLLVNLMPVVTFGFRFAQGARFEAIELAGAALVIGSLMANNLYLRWMTARLHARQ
ncbi:MAG: DMT family transporter [Burkholderiales bacterium]